MVNKRFLLVIAIGLCVQLRAEYVKGELLYHNGFHNEESISGWTPSFPGMFQPGGGIDGKGAVHLKDNQLISHELNPAEINGDVIFEVVYKGSNIKETGKPYFGAKAMLIIEQKDKATIWSEPVNMTRFGTFGWKTVRKIERIPNHVDRLTLRLGLENASGEYWCDSVSIYRCRKAVAAEPRRASESIMPGSWHGGNFRGVMSGYDLSETAFQTMATWNVNLIRYQMNPQKGRDISTPEKYIAWIKDEIVKIDRLLVLCKKYGIKMVLDLHRGPSGSRRTAASSNIISDSKAVVTQVKDAWTILAKHYRGNSLIYGYDILNEPQCEDFVGNEKFPWRRISTEIVKTIRRIDPNTPIIVEADLSDVRRLHYIDAPNIIYSIHAYSPIEYTHQGVTSNRSLEWSYPGDIQGIEWNRAALRKDLQRVRDFQLKHNVPIFVGEFSAVIWASGRERYLADLIDIFEEYGWDWTYHAFREWPGWSLEYTADKPMTFNPDPNNAALKAVLGVLKKNPKTVSAP